MASGFGQSDWNGDDWADDNPETPQDIDLEDDDETPTVPCPNCRRAIPDFTDRCPYCGDWVTQGAGDRRPGLWLVLLVIIVLVVFLLWSVA